MTRTPVTRALVAARRAVCAAPLAWSRPAPGARAAQSAPPGRAAGGRSARLAAMKKDAASDVESMRELSQQMVDQIFSYAELGYQEFETSTLPHGDAGKERVPHRAQHRGHSDRLDRDVGKRAAGDRARVGHRRHSAGVAETGRRLSRSDCGGSARPRRRPQLRNAAADHGGSGREEDHGARASVGHAEALAGRRRGARRRQGVLRARGRLQGRGHLPLHARRQQLQRLVGRSRGHRRGVGGVHLQGRGRARGRESLARPVGARCRRVDGHRLEFPPRTPAAVAALALRHHQRRRPAQRRAGQRQRLVLLPRDRLRPHQGAA